MAFDWQVFAQEVGKTFDRASAGIRQQAEEKRMDKRAIALFKEKKDLELKALDEKLMIELPYKIEQDNHITMQKRKLAEEADERNKQFVMWSEERNKKLNLFAGSEGWADAIDRARKGKGISEVEIMKIEDAILQVKAGKVIDPSVFEALTPFDRIPIMELINKNNQVTQQHKEKMAELKKDAARYNDLVDFRKRQEEARVRAEQRAVEREERLVAGADLASLNQAQVMAKRYTDMRDDLNTGVEKAATEFSKYRTELLTELEDTDKINAKGEAFAKIGGKKKLSLFDDAGEVDEEAVKKFVKHFPRYRGRFKRLDVLRKNVEIRNQERDEAFGGAPAEPISEADIPEEEIQSAMAAGLTREQAIEQYKKFLATRK